VTSTAKLGFSLSAKYGFFFSPVNIVQGNLVGLYQNLIELSGAN
jgi:hypothetical protein